MRRMRLCKSRNVEYPHDSVLTVIPAGSSFSSTDHLVLMSPKTQRLVISSELSFEIRAEGM